MRLKIFALKSAVSRPRNILLCLISACITLNSSPTLGQNPKTLAEVQQIVKTYCGACHAVPSPSVMPRKDWPYAVKRMAELAAERAGRELISEEHIRDITAYYYGSSPEALGVLPIDESAGPLNFSFNEWASTGVFPLISHIQSTNLRGKGTEFLVCDAESNEVRLLYKKGKTWREQTLANIALPAHTEVLDYDQDGDMDIIVSSLGKFFPPVSLDIGKVILLRQQKKGKFTQEILLENVPRVLQTRAMDVDEDGDPDLLVSIFGNNQYGEIAWLENRGKEKPLKHSILALSGSLNVSPVDLNGDGRLDIVSLISQEYEMIVAMINKGKGEFDKSVIFQAPEPMIGSTSLELYDIDGDKDMDMLFTNGDAHDLQTDPKPYHGVQWLENQGNMKFTFHRLDRFYGAVKAKATDMDLDGDMDIVVASWNNLWDDPERQTLIWLENDGKQNFSRHRLLSRPHSVVNFELIDMNNDRYPDIVAGIFKIDLLKNKVEIENGMEKGEGESFDFKSKKTRIMYLENSGLPKK